ncbi:MULTISPECIES: carboxylesterase/lipase family protein [Mycobacterium]|uniref:Carboxylic ester hydrolase n=1 Tax=Mycobacterium gordonae TaxID=1778 RepID=A0A1A6BCM7_MYCGO|nr:MULTISPECIES: carboxylesterase/lipase family protein [Mycobacterium]MBX9982359.1 carboxylesterase/lipase family protein [Mycobacterium gordonae]MCQ4364956.1 carboxylesterase/lipase family protein [Mycobacterium gordonae]MCV7007206.1 carboxylesterase/lipase family protein [Mycobacterium gordonae]OBS00127.1 carboxylesterase [Mycobacterium gordonae]ODR24562.1 carboxylesterase [Mycobacterium gordonae]
MHERIVRARTTAGTVEGFTRDGVNRWRSIPYARPPVGPLRYRAPQPVQPWSGVRHCHGFANCAPQQRRYTMLGVGRYQPMSEDCLTLNVVTPEAGASEPMPVMVFIHGGGYILGSSATPLYDGAALARRGCVYVSVNYRLGALGCLDLSSLSTQDVTIDGNLYLRDLVMALRWVKDNIANFGGDPDNVTIFGESAGAHITATLLAVPEAAGLFHRAISESPAAGMTRSTEVAAEFATRFAELLGARSKDAANAVMRASAAQLVETQHRLIDQGMQKRLGAFPIGPVFGDEVVPVDPVEAMRSGQAHQVPLIVGTNAEEGRLFTRFLGMLPTNKTMVEALLAEVEPAARERITAAYPKYPKSEACIQLGGDFAFSTAAWQIAEAHTHHAPTYLYRYDYAPRTLQWSGFGATHATELFAVFDIYRTRLGALLTAAADRGPALRVSNDVQRRWRSFSRSGVPGDDWPVYTHEDRAVMVFDRKSRIEFDPHQHRRLAWDGFTLAR